MFTFTGTWRKMKPWLSELVGNLANISWYLLCAQHWAQRHNKSNSCSVFTTSQIAAFHFSESDWGWLSITFFYLSNFLLFKGPTPSLNPERLKCQIIALNQWFLVPNVKKKLMKTTDTLEKEKPDPMHWIVFGRRHPVNGQDKDFEVPILEFEFWFCHSLLSPSHDLLISQKGVILPTSWSLCNN